MDITTQPNETSSAPAVVLGLFLLCCMALAAGVAALFMVDPVVVLAVLRLAGAAALCGRAQLFPHGALR